MSALDPQFPLYVVSKGRHEYMMTSKTLTHMKAHHFLVVEPPQVADYQQAVQSMGLLATVLPLDMSYKDRYELCDELGTSKSTGPGPARNFCWDHSVNSGFAWHWVMDDNIRTFYRLNRNLKFRLRVASFWRAMEDFCLRYENVAMAGPNYEMFVPRNAKHPAFILNTRIYSCNLIRNDLPFRWRGRYNEDTILSLDVLKAGWCTVEFNAFLQKKIRTQSIKGGCTDEFYHVEGTLQPGQTYADNGTLAKSQMLAAVHPDVAKLVWKFQRWHHYVDYSPFERNALKLKPGIQIQQGVNDYGMHLVAATDQELVSEPEDFAPETFEAPEAPLIDADADAEYWQRREDFGVNGDATTPGFFKPAEELAAEQPPGDWTQAQFDFSAGS